MINSIYSGLSGLHTHQTKMDVISHNIANVNTLGYESKSTFGDTISQLFNENQNDTNTLEVPKISNVNLSVEFTEMINAKNGFSLNAKLITTSDETLKELLNLSK